MIEIDRVAEKKVRGEKAGRRDSHKKSGDWMERGSRGASPDCLPNFAQPDAAHRH